MMKLSGGPFDPRRQCLRHNRQTRSPGHPMRAGKTCKFHWDWKSQRRNATIPMQDERFQERQKTDAFRGPKGNVWCTKKRQVVSYSNTLKAMLYPVLLLFQPDQILLDYFQMGFTFSNNQWTQGKQNGNLRWFHKSSWGTWTISFDVWITRMFLLDTSLFKRMYYVRYKRRTRNRSLIKVTSPEVMA